MKIDELREIVRAFWKAVNQFHPPPGKGDALRLAVVAAVGTLARSGLDVSRYLGGRRLYSVSSSVEGGLAACAVMLLTALDHWVIADTDQEQERFESINMTLADIVWYAATAVTAFEEGIPYWGWQKRATRCLGGIYNWPGLDLEREVKIFLEDTCGDKVALAMLDAKDSHGVVYSPEDYRGVKDLALPWVKETGHVSPVRRWKQSGVA